MQFNSAKKSTSSNHWQKMLFLSPFQQWKGFYSLEKCYHCNQEYPICWKHYCQDDDHPVNRDFTSLDTCTQIYFIKHYGTNLQFPRLAFTGYVPDSKWFTVDFLMHPRKNEKRNKGSFNKSQKISKTKSQCKTMTS